MSKQCDKCSHQKVCLVKLEYGNILNQIEHDVAKHELIKVEVICSEFRVKEDYQFKR